MNGVIYARYSSDRQTEQSIEGQLRECQEYADANNIKIDTANSLTEQEKALLAFYRTASEEGKQEIIQFVNQKINGSD